MAREQSPIAGDTVIGTKSEEMPVKLTVDELAEMARRLAAVQEEMESHESHEQQMKAQLKATKERLASERSLLAMNVRNKTEMRPVEIQEEASFKTGVVIEVRVDTGAIVRKRVLHDHERQTHLPAFEERRASETTEKPSRKRNVKPEPPKAA